MRINEGYISRPANSNIDETRQLNLHTTDSVYQIYYRRYVQFYSGDTHQLNYVYDRHRRVHVTKGQR